MKKSRQAGTVDEEAATVDQHRQGGRRNTSRASRLVLLLLAGLLAFVFAAPSQAATIDWKSNAGTAAWATGSNWVGENAPANDLVTDIAQFNQTSYTSQPNAGTVSVNGLVIGSSSAVLTLSGTALTVGSGDISIGSENAVTISTALAGPASLTKSGAGTLSLSNTANDFSGGITLNAGVLASGSSTTTPFGSGPLTLAGGRLEFSKGNYANDVIVSGSAAVRGVNGMSQGPVWTGNWTINSGTLRFDSVGTYNTTFSGLVTMNADLTVEALATHNVKWTGGFALNGAARTLTVNNSGAVVTVTISGPLSNTVGAGTALTLTGSGAVTVGALTVSGANSTAVNVDSTTGGAYTFNSTTGTYAGGTTLTSGTMIIGANSTVSGGAITGGPLGTGPLMLAGGLVEHGGLTLANPVIVSDSVTIRGRATMTQGPSWTGNWTINPGAGTLTFESVGATFNTTLSGTVTMNADLTLAVLDTQPVTFTGGFNAVAERTLTKTGVCAMNLSGVMGIRLLGGADLLTADSFVVYTNAGGVLTDTTTWEDSTMWTQGGTPGSNITATLVGGLNRGTFSAAGGRVTFAATNMGYVTVNGFTAGSARRVVMGFDGTPDLDAIRAGLAAAHPEWTRFSTIGTDKVTFVVIPKATGTGYFAWDDKHSSLGADVTYIRVGPPGSGIVLTIY